MQEGRLTPTEERALNHAILLLKTMAANTANVAQAEKIFQSLRSYKERVVRSRAVRNRKEIRTPASLKTPDVS